MNTILQKLAVLWANTEIRLVLIVAAMLLVAYYFGGPIAAHLRRRQRHAPAATRTEREGKRERSNEQRLEDLFWISLAICTAVGVFASMVWFALGIIGFLFTGYALVVLYQRWYRQDKLLTKVNEATCKIIVLGGKFSFILMEFVDHVRLNAELAKILTSDKDMCQKIGHNFYPGDIVDINRNELTNYRPQLEALLHSHGSLIGHRIASILGGVQVIGNPWNRSVRTWGYTDFVIETKETTRESGSTFRVLKLTRNPVKGVSELRLGQTLKRLLLESMETGMVDNQAGVAGQELGLGFRFDVEVILTLRPINPYKAIYDAGDWAEQLMALILPFVSVIVGQTPSSQLISLRDQIGERLTQALRGIRTEWTWSDDRKRITGVKKIHVTPPDAERVAQDIATPPANPTDASDQRQSNTLEIIYQVLGLEIVRAEIGEIEASDPADTEKLQRVFEYQLRSAAEATRGIGEGKRFEEVLAKLQVNPDLANKLLDTDAIKAAALPKGNVTMFLGGGGSSGADPMAAILSQLQRTHDLLAQRGGRTSGGGRPSGRSPSTNPRRPRTGGQSGGERRES